MNGINKIDVMLMLGIMVALFLEVVLKVPINALRGVLSSNKSWQ